MQPTNRLTPAMGDTDMMRGDPESIGNRFRRQPAIYCDVKDSKGNHCPNKPVGRTMHQGHDVNVCQPCLENIQEGAYTQRMFRMKAGAASAELVEYSTHEIAVEIARRKRKAANDLRSSLGMAKKARKKRK